MNLFACKLFLVLIVFQQSSAKVCSTTISVIRKVPETYRYTYYEAYESYDCIICDCTKSRLAVNIGTRIVEKLVNETVNVCCEGYVEDDSEDSDGLKCIPLCNPPCDNGYCKKPNECACESGYTNDPNDALNRCVPLCLEGCAISDCLPTCSQYDDYDTSEIDLCSGTCLNGTCIAPGICHCDPGFWRQSEACKPICSSCEHGTCVAPGLCKCDFGWREECGSCQPACSGCEHGRCKAPGQCECDAGYKAENGKCEPHCSNCGNGNCLAPDICACDPGWYLNGTECFPHCKAVCGNGTCIAPNVCECYPGYQVPSQEEYVNEEPLCVPVCSDCAELCVAPDVCKCKPQYKTIYTTLDGRSCDCFDCTDVSRKCERLTCKIDNDVTNIEASMEEINESEIFTATSKHTDESNSVSLANATSSAKHESINDSSCTLKMAKFTYHWIYAAIIIVELLVILLMIAMMKRKNILNCLQIKKFVPQDKPNAEVSVHYTSSVTCSKLKDTLDTENS